MREPVFTLHVLLYGDHADLAYRCLSSIRDAGNGLQVGTILWLNQVSSATRAVVSGFAKQYATPEAPVLVIGSDRINHPKNHVLWTMFYGSVIPAELRQSKYIVSIDDDSFIDWRDSSCYWHFLANFLESKDTDLAGKIYRIRLRGRQHEAIAQCPAWFNGGKPAAREVITFPTGGFWVAKREKLAEIGFPWPQLGHKSEDYLLGYAAQRHGWRMHEIPMGFMVNAALGGGHSTAPTRGMNPEHWGESGLPIAVDPAKFKPFSSELLVEYSDLRLYKGSAEDT